MIGRRPFPSAVVATLSVREVGEGDCVMLDATTPAGDVIGLAVPLVSLVDAAYAAWGMSEADPGRPS